MTSPFAQPSAGGDNFEPKDFNGALLLIYPKSYNPHETTKFGPSTSADVDVVVVDRPDLTTGQPTYKHNARVFGNLANSVRDSIGAVVLGRLGQGENTKGNPPWILLEHTDAEMSQSLPIHDAYTRGQFKQPDSPNAQASAAQDPWAGTNATPAPPAPQASPTLAPATAAPAAAATGDDKIVFLIGKGLDAAKVVAMDQATRDMLASRF